MSLNGGVRNTGHHKLININDRRYEVDLLSATLEMLTCNTETYNP